MQTTAQRTMQPSGLGLAPGSLARPCPAPAPRSALAQRVQQRQRVVTHANVLLEVLLSAPAGAAAVAAATATAGNRITEIKHLQSPEGLAPLGAAVLGDAVAHSIPLVGPLLTLLSEPAGAAAGVAYMMSIVLSSPSVDPKTLAPSGTILNAKTAEDVRGAVRVPFTQILPTTLKVVDNSNSGSSGAGWAPGADGLPSLPITTVVGVIGVGCVILEVLAHAPVLSLFMPRVLQVAGWLALAGAVLDKRDT